MALCGEMAIGPRGRCARRTRAASAAARTGIWPPRRSGRTWAWPSGRRGPPARRAQRRQSVDPAPRQPAARPPCGSRNAHGHVRARRGDAEGEPLAPVLHSDQRRGHIRAAFRRVSGLCGNRPDGSPRLRSGRPAATWQASPHRAWSVRRFDRAPLPPPLGPRPSQRSEHVTVVVLTVDAGLAERARHAAGTEPIEVTPGPGGGPIRSRDHHRLRRGVAADRSGAVPGPALGPRRRGGRRRVPLPRMATA